MSKEKIDQENKSNCQSNQDLKKRNKQENSDSKRKIFGDYFNEDGVRYIGERYAYLGCKYCLGEQFTKECTDQLTPSSPLEMTKYRCNKCGHTVEVRANLIVLNGEEENNER